MTQQAARTRQLGEIERDFIGEFGEALGAETVSAVIQESFDHLSAKATVSDFVGMLARRASRKRLLELVAGRSSGRGRSDAAAQAASPESPTRT